jgi:hypothetical protein
MSVWSEILHPRVGGKFTNSNRTQQKTPRIHVNHVAVGGGKGGNGKGKKKKGPTAGELAEVGQVEAGNVYTTDGGKTWSVLGSKTKGTATKMVQQAIKDGLLTMPGKGSHMPGVTKTGRTDFAKSGRTMPKAKAPGIAKAAAKKAAAAQKHQQVVARVAANKAKSAAQAQIAAAGKAAQLPAGRTPLSASRAGVRSTVSSRNRAR